MEWRMDIQTLTLAICCYLHPPSVAVHVKHTHTDKIIGEGNCKSMLLVGEGESGAVLDTYFATPYLQDQDHFTFVILSYLPVLVRTISALAQHFKDDSTAPTATASEGSLVSWECLLSSSNSCLWKMAASASRAIWAQRDHGEGSGGLLSITHTSTAEPFTPLGVIGKCVARILVKQG